MNKKGSRVIRATTIHVFNHYRDIYLSISAEFFLHLLHKYYINFILFTLLLKEDFRVRSRRGCCQCFSFYKSSLLSSGRRYSPSLRNNDLLFLSSSSTLGCKVLRPRSGTYHTSFVSHSSSCSIFHTISVSSSVISFNGHQFPLTEIFPWLL